jgi:hypothetical protein
VGGTQISKGTTAQKFNPNYTTPYIRVNTDSTDNGINHLVVSDGITSRQVAYKGDLPFIDTVTLSTRANNKKGYDSLALVLVNNSGGAKQIKVGTYLSRPTIGTYGIGFYWSSDSAFWSYSDGVNPWVDIRSAAASSVPSFLNIQANALGVTQDPSKGLLLDNITAAAAGAQQISPAIVWGAQGWKIAATAASQSVKFQAFVLPVQGSSNPTGTWQLQKSINGGGYSNVMSVTSDAIEAKFSSAGLTLTNGGINFSGGGVVAQQLITGGTWTFNFNSGLAALNAWVFTHAASSVTSGTAQNVVTTGTFNPTSGTGSYNSMTLSPTINQTGGANGATRGLYINPTLTAAADFRAIEISAGKTILAPATTGRTSLNIPSGTAPTSPNHGDVWTDASHIFAYLSGSTYQLDQQGVSNYTHNISTPTTGGTVNLVNKQYNIINPAGTIAALTVNLPSSPSNNDVVYIKYTQTVTTVTYGNGTVVDGITGPTAGTIVVLVYDSGTTSWY